MQAETNHLQSAFHMTKGDVLQVSVPQASFLQKYQWFTFKTKDGLPYFMLSPYAYHKAMIFQPEATNNQSPEFVKCSDTRYTPIW